VALAPAAAAESFVVFAAASLQGPLEQVAAAFEHSRHHTARISYASSATLARQIEAGAPAAIFISADEDWMDYLDKRALLRAPRVDLLANELVIVAPAASRTSLRIEPGFPLAAALGKGRLAIADPASVPAGKYARAALESLQVWPSVAARLAPAENVRAALAMVAREEAPLGIVYRTDAASDYRVRVVGAFPKQTHPAIVYPLAQLRGAGAAAIEFAAFAAGPQARAIWTRYGFGMP
jgi:molybdate transport system substrate-binding protein